jgi:dihydrofolate reductase
MRKVIVSNLVSLDGFIAGPNGEIDWFRADDKEFTQYAVDLVTVVGTILFGRVTYQMMASYWPTATEEEPRITAAMNDLPKIVFSTTLDKLDWKNSRLVKANMGEEVSRLKQQPGKDMVIFGSGSLVSGLTRLGLIDEYRIVVNPVVLGSGIPLFKDIENRLSLKLLTTRTFDSGVVVLYYRPDEQTHGDLR